MTLYEETTKNCWLTNKQEFESIIVQILPNLIEIDVPVIWRILLEY